MNDHTPIDQLARGRRTIRFDRLRLNGFKSFADAAEVVIETGMTGVVGPNGCGKSNLLEALRWVLGETSARRMRGEGMNDVIFGGSERRPARNVAEVSLILDNSDRAAPPELNESDQLEVVRRIDRGQGTSYRVNGRQVRQRDVQILFQDHAAGATSPAIVSQGRVGALIAAKPSERRTVLEEAAGVSGLSSRRHDSENKLRTAEQNLDRADDALVQSSDVLGALRRQARQAVRRREIDGLVRAAQATVLAIRLKSASEQIAAAREAHAGNEAKVAEAILAARRAGEERDAAVAALEPLRQRRAAAETAFARAAAKLESLSGETERHTQELDEARRRVIDLANDRTREDQAIGESERLIEKLSQERIQLASERADADVEMELASDAATNARETVMQADAEASAVASEVSGREASRNAALSLQIDAQRRLDAVVARLAQSERRLADAKAGMPDEARFEEMREALVLAEERLASATERVLETEAALEAAMSSERAATEAAGKARNELARARAEAEGLSAIPASETSRAPVSAEIVIEAGFESAVASALGEALGAGRDSGERLWWSGPRAAPPNLPARVRTLASVVTGSGVLQAALEGIGLVDDDAALDAVAAAGLASGAMLVAPSGAFLRWDGYRGRGGGGGGVEAGLVRLARLRALNEAVEVLEPELMRAEQAGQLARGALEQWRRADQEARREAREASDGVRLSREAFTQIERAGETARRALAVAESEFAGIRNERQQALANLSEANDAVASVPDDNEARTRLAEAKRRVDVAREAETGARVALERFIQQSNARRARIDAIVREEAQWSGRLIQARTRRDELSVRSEEAERLLAEMEQRPASSGAALVEAQEILVTSGRESEEASAALVAGEALREKLEAASRTAEAALATLREERATLVAAIGQGQANLDAVLAAIAEKLAVPPDEVEGIARADGSPLKPDLAGAESRLSRLERERENLGPVNFLAEAELADHQKRYEEMERGRDEIKQAIAKLRKAIEEINKEARTKLEDAFRLIDRNFADLFSRLFSGGEAHLRLVGSEDILEAGLEIYASPPGKRLQVLSLLSGGEQALTAMALIFAAFLCNPSPICVLDEVDAPLDDTNADRLCRLIEVMSLNDATRFLVVTHNPLTMARMHRLYGVTMGERGVSSLTKVDLDKAIEIIDQ